MNPIQFEYPQRKFIFSKNLELFFNLALPVGPYVELEMIRDMIPQIEPLPIAIPIAAPIAIPSKYHKKSWKIPEILILNLIFS